MKIFRTLLTILLALCIAIGAVSCTFIINTPQAEGLELKIYEYLENKYPDLEFEIQSYTHDTYTNGKYVFNVLCKTTGIEFLVYQSSFLTTDSYTVTYANLAMEEMLVGVLGENTKNVKSLQWLDPYADGSKGYKFREVDLDTLPESVVGINSVFQIAIYAQTTDEVFHSLKGITEKLDEAGVHCDSIAFEWVQNDYTIVFTTDTCTINYASEEELTKFINYVDSAKKTDEFVTVSFVSRVKRVEISTNDIDSGKYIPGLNENPSDTNQREPNPHHPTTEQEPNTEQPAVE